MLKMADEVPEVVKWHGITGSHCSILKVVVTTTKELGKVIEKLREFGETSTSRILSSNTVSKIVSRETLF
jgi:Lrp/AsnC family leucine-responsive transcriptional regulator